jgi:hypothetical protein
MPEELPAEGGAPQDNGQPEVDWQKRYTDTHAEYNRLNERFSSFQKDPEALVEFIREHHPDMLHENEEPEEESEYEPEYEGEDPRIAQLAQQTQQFQQWQQQVEADRAQARFTAHLDEIRGDREVNQIGRDWILQKAIELGDNKTALKKAAEQWFEFEDSIRGPVRQEKPTKPQAGKAGEPAYDPRDRNARRARMAAAIEAANQD